MGNSAILNNINRRNRLNTGKTSLSIGIGIIIGVVISVLLAPFAAKGFIIPAQSLSHTPSIQADLSQVNLSNNSLSYGPHFVSSIEVNIRKSLKKQIIIDPGHGGVDDGCEWNGVSEKNINLDIANKLKYILMQNDFEIVMTRSDDTYIEPPTRAEIANASGIELFISIHQNSYEDTSIQGIETLYGESTSKKESEAFANSMQLILTEDIKLEELNRGITHRPDLYILNKTNMTACLVETGYLSNPYERNILSDEAQRLMIAEKLAIGIQDYIEQTNKEIFDSNQNRKLDVNSYNSGSDEIIDESETVIEPKINTVSEPETSLALERLHAEQKPEKTMQLTFDDGPRESTTPIILDILREHNIKATFFLVGANVEKYPEIVKRIVDEGHAIGVHCYSHEYEEIYASVESFMNDFEKASELIEEASGIRPVIFRFPGGSINNFNRIVYKDIINKMTQKGYIYYDWNGSLEDTMGNTTKEKLIQSALDTTDGRNRIVMLAHDTKAATVEVLEDLLITFNDYDFDIIKELDTPIQFK